MTFYIVRRTLALRILNIGLKLVSGGHRRNSRRSPFVYFVELVQLAVASLW